MSSTVAVARKRNRVRLKSVSLFFLSAMHRRRRASVLSPCSLAAPRARSARRAPRSASSSMPTVSAENGGAVYGATELGHRAICLI